MRAFHYVFNNRLAFKNLFYYYVTDFSLAVLLLLLLLFMCSTLWCNCKPLWVAESAVEISIIIITIYNWQKYKQVPCTDLTNQKQLIKSQIYVIHCLNNDTCLAGCLHFSGTQHGNPHGPKQEPAFAISNTSKMWRESGKNEVEIRKQEIPGSGQSTHGYILIYSRL